MMERMLDLSTPMPKAMVATMTWFLSARKSSCMVFRDWVDMPAW